MQWSKLKTRVKALLDPAVSKRIDFHVTSYRKSHDEAEKAWITVDSREVFVASRYQHQWGKAEYKPQDFGDALRHYLDLKISDALIDPNPLIRALAIADRRLGARRLSQVKLERDEHPLVTLFYELRTEPKSDLQGQVRSNKSR